MSYPDEDKVLLKEGWFIFLFILFFIIGIVSFVLVSKGVL